MKLHHIKQKIKKYYSLNNIVVLVAFLIALSWLWGTMDALQRNFTLQQQVDTRRQEIELLALENENAELQNDYYESDEYLEISARERLNKAAPGEKVLILPPNTVPDKDPEPKNNARSVAPSNYEQWMNFLYGAGN